MKSPSPFTRRRIRSDPPSPASGSARHRPTLGVRVRLLVFIVGSGLLVLGAAGGIAFRVAEDTTLREIHQRAETLAADTALDIGERIARLRVAARAIAAADTALGQAGARDLDLMRSILRQIGQRELDFLSAYVFYEPQVIPGREYAVVWETRDETQLNFATKPFVPNVPGESVYDPNQPLYDYRSNPRYTAAQAAGGFVWTPLFRDVGGREGNVIVTSGVEPLYDEGGRFVGVAGVDLQFGQIRTYIAGVKPTQNGYALLLDDNGTILTHSRDKLVGVINRPLLDLAAETGSDALRQLGEQMLAGRFGVIDMTDPLTGEEVLAAYAPLEEIGWSISLLIPRADLLGGVESLRFSLLALIGGSLAVMAGVGLLVSASFVRPILRLTRTATRIADGDLRHTAVVERDDEVGALARAFNSMTTQIRELIGTLEARVDARTEQLRASADVGRAVASILDPGELLSAVVTLITERFGFYYAAVFTLSEDGRYAWLRAATGEVGQALMVRGHKLEVGGESMVGTVTKTRKPRIALDVGAEAVRFANPLLPGTRSEIALPLVVGERVLGALDVQSTQAAAFDESSVAVLQSMADQVAVALANAQSFNIVQSALRQSTRLYELSRSLFAASALPDAYSALIQEEARLPGLDRISLLLIAARDADGQPLEYELAAEWDALEGMRVQPGTLLPASRVPMSRLADRGSIVVVRDVHDVRVPLTTRRTLELAGLKAAALVPLIVRGQYEGVLVAAARQSIEFSEADVRYLQAAVEQLSVVLSGLRSNIETQAALDRVAQLNQRMSGEAWRQYLAARHGITVESGRASPPEADGEGRDVSDASINRLSAPIVVRGETLGVLDLEDADGARQWTDEDGDLLNAVTGEVALAIDNARLIEQTQRRAAREAELNRVTERIRRASDIDTILRVATEELSRSLNTSHASVRLGEAAELAGHRNGD